MNFLPNTAAIRRAVHILFRSNRIDMAVAFIRADWEEILAGYGGKLRVICWLSSTNTDPYAVKSLINPSGYHRETAPRYALQGLFGFLNRRRCRFGQPLKSRVERQ